MAWSWGDSFDLYAATADMANGYWDSGAFAGITLVAGRFAGSQALQLGNSGVIVCTKSSAVNDAVHHLVVAVRYASAFSGTTAQSYLQLLDGTTGQVCVVFRGDGTILLTSGTAAGTTLATYATAVATVSTWYVFEFEVIINNSTGRFRARRNGNTVDDFDSGAVLNTRVSANNYANKMQLGISSNAVTTQIDDLFWRSDASSVAWMGDIRCYTRMPASDASVTFSRLGGATNTSQVNEAHQDGLTSYVFDSNPGDADFYNIGSIASTPVTTFAVVTRGYMIKSDAGTRTAAVQLKSGGTTVASPTLVLTTSGWLWAWRMDLVDPATSAAWTAAGVNGVQIGPTTIA